MRKVNVVRPRGWATDDGRCGDARPVLCHLTREARLLCGIRGQYAGYLLLCEKALGGRVSKAQGFWWRYGYVGGLFIGEKGLKEDSHRVT
jgi:hypothetical protein